MTTSALNIRLVGVALFLSAFLSGCATTHTAKDNAGRSKNDNYLVTEAFYGSLVDDEEQIDIAKLNLFMTRMPKGGDIHHHFSGTIYVETYLDWVAKKRWFINSCNLKIAKTTTEVKQPCNALTIDELRNNFERYRKLLTLWSDKDFSNHYHEQPAPDTNFFSTFGYFDPISDEYPNEGMTIIKNRAIAENVAYIETMYKRTGLSYSNLINESTQKSFTERLKATTSQSEVDTILAELTKVFTQQESFYGDINHFVAQVNTAHHNIDNDHFTMRYQTYTVRVQNPVQVYLELLSGFAATTQSPLLVGVNIVAPENHHVSMRDYTLHMRMYNYLSRLYPSVNRALHAGELTLGMVRPEGLLFHIEEAIDIAGAQRIGHGIDIPYETNSLSIIEKMKRGIAVEINLTSNEFILGVAGNAHPYIIYQEFGVPIVISTDDSGVSRNNLTNEYVLLASRYQPSYAQLKDYVYNSIKFSFMSEQDKQQVVKRIDKQFIKFETEIAELVLQNQ